MIQPLGFNILVEKQESEETTSSSGIIVPMKISRNIVIAKGDDVTKLIHGDEVFFMDGMGAKINFEGKEYFLLTEGAILGKIV